MLNAKRTQAGVTSRRIHFQADANKWWTKPVSVVWEEAIHPRTSRPSTLDSHVNFAVRVRQRRLGFCDSIGTGNELQRRKKLSFEVLELWIINGRTDHCCSRIGLLEHEGRKKETCFEKSARTRPLSFIRYDTEVRTKKSKEVWMKRVQANTLFPRLYGLRIYLLRDNCSITMKVDPRANGWD